MFRRPPRAAACRCSVPRGARRSSPPPAGRKTFGCGLVFLAGRVKKERKQNDTDETSSSIPPNFQSKAVQRAALRLRGAEPDGDGKRWGARGGLLPPGRMEGQRHIHPPGSRHEASQYAPVSAGQGLGSGERGAAAELHKTCREPAGAPIARPSPSGAPCWVRRGKREFFIKKKKKKKWKRFGILKLFVRKSPPGTSLGELVARGIAPRGDFGVRSSRAGSGKFS